MSRMTLSDRIRIEAGIYGKPSLSEIANKIQKSPSTRRSKLDGETPFELADSEEFQRLKTVMGLEAIPADEVRLTPRLLNKK